MSLAELGRYARNETHMVLGLLRSHGVEAIAFDGEASIGEGSAFLIPVRVMVEADELDRARALLPE